MGAKISSSIGMHKNEVEYNLTFNPSKCAVYLMWQFSWQCLLGLK